MTAASPSTASTISPAPSRPSWRAYPEARLSPWRVSGTGTGSPPRERGPAAAPPPGPIRPSGEPPPGGPPGAWGGVGNGSGTAEERGPAGALVLVGDPVPV